VQGKIFLLDRKRQLVPLEETAYDSEDLLQTLLADYPDLLAGDQIDDQHPRRWLLIRREATVPDREAGAGRWSVDHLFVDQDAIPTLVEVKRSSDTRIRREVVGQLLEYAANAVAFWPVEKIRAEFEHRCEQEGFATEQALHEFLGPEADEEEFWNRVKTNLDLGKVRLLFVADKISSELQRIVEYLNRQMRETEVLAVEVRQFEGEGRTTLVPRVLGQKVKAELPRPRLWDEASLLARLEPPDLEIAQRILKWAAKHGLEVKGGRGAKYAGLNLVLDADGEELRPLYLYEGFEHYPPSLNIQFDLMGPAFRPIEKRRELTDRINRATGAGISPEKSYPAFSFASLRSSSAESALMEALDWLLRELTTERATKEND
jgi:hypothetical protein